MDEMRQERARGPDAQDPDAQGGAENPLGARRRAHERYRLTRELPDVAAQQLSGIAVQAMGHRRSTDPAELRRVLGVIGRAAASALAALRMLVRLLRETPPAGVDELDEIAELTNPVPPAQAAAEAAARLAALGFDVRIDVPESVDRLDPTLRRSIARTMELVADEAERCRLAGELCELSVRTGEHETRVQVRCEQVSGLLDDLGSGLDGLRERARLAGGTLDARVGRDWLVLVRLPFEL